ncbi:unnamed protein product [Triticum turgidum subsp. durum]|uniref:F-box domain-containing protein n=1 Tax=Triticum turgidum subsp. durum TaxID=4567 RepID=A0A9R0ZUB7_TRITD|nr:unnamed protein product [Triticum turgidum subsp. durum]
MKPNSSPLKKKKKKKKAKPSTPFPPKSQTPMDELAGDSRRADSAPPLPHLPDDMLVEIFLRLPPEPIHLFRASFVCKHWRGLVHDARFLRRFRDFHGGTPPVLGFFNNQPVSPLFAPTSDGFAVPGAATMRHGEWWALDCRHGRALLLDQRHGRLLVWDLMNGDKHYLPFPTQAHLERVEYNGAVLCAAGHADHGDCHLCPFLVAFVFSQQSDFNTSACVYSSEISVWGEIYSIEIPNVLVTWAPTPLIGNTLYWMLDTSGGAIKNECWIVEFDLDAHNLDLTGEIPYYVLDKYNRQIVLMPADDGRLGFAGVDKFSLHLWSSVACVDGMVTWAHCRVIDLENFLALEAVAACQYVPDAVGYAEDANVIFIRVDPNIYMIHLNTMQIEEVSEKGAYWFVFPYTSFYTPAKALRSCFIAHDCHRFIGSFFS